MKVLQINSIYRTKSTGRTTKEMHEYFMKIGIDSFVASPNLNGLKTNGYKIGNRFDRLIHSILSRITGLQGYYSTMSTKKLIKYIKILNPDIIIIRNVHANYLNLKLLLNYIASTSIKVVFVLHDSWLYTGKCVYYIESSCSSWKQNCGNCPLLKSGNKSYFFDRSKKMLLDKKELYLKLKKQYAAIGVSKWVEDDLKMSIMDSAKIITHIYNWISFDIFNPLAKSGMRSRYKLIDKFVILCVASKWNKSKGINVIFELSRIIPDSMTIVLVGEYPKHSKLNNVIFAGPIWDEKILAGYYSEADVFLNPSIQETFGKTTAESLSCGTPVVAYASTATPELVGSDGQCGYLYDKQDPNLILSLLLKIRTQTKMHFYDNCISRSKRMFDKNTNLSYYLKIFEMLQSNE